MLVFLYMNPETRNCQNCKTDFVIEPEDFQFYEKIKVPAPTFCPECRLVRRMATRNVRSLFWHTCAKCNQRMLSCYRPESGYTVWCLSCYKSDDWNPLSYGREYDFSKTFFEQFDTFLKTVPLPAVSLVGNCVNADYNNFVFSSKNVYLSSSTIDSEDVYYSLNTDRSKTVFECINCKDGDTLFETIDSTRNFHTFWVQNTHSCVESYFLYDAANCSDCFMSSTIRNKQYYFRNQQYSKEEYQKRISQIDFGSHEVVKELLVEYLELRKKAIHKYGSIYQSVMSTGDYIENSKDCVSCFDIYGSENTRYSNRIVRSKECADVFGAIGGELLYESHGTGSTSVNSKSMFLCNAVTDSEYGVLCLNTKDIFACASLNKNSYCIFNTQYSKEDYAALREKIIAHMNEVPYVDKKGRSYVYGDFSPICFSPFPYNDTAAQDFFPETEESALGKGYEWEEKKDSKYHVTLQHENIPDRITDTTDGVCNEVIRCETAGQNVGCTGAFRITSEEFGFYKRYTIALPRSCYICRYAERSKRINPMKLWNRECMCDIQTHNHTGKCSNEFETSYSPDCEEKVYCESCYQKEVL